MSKPFEELLAALNTQVEQSDQLAKSVAAGPADENDEDDAAIAAAAAEAAAAGGTPEAAPGAAPMATDDDDAPTLGKSFEVTGANGEKHQAVDATELVKSLMERAEAHDETLAKAIGSFTTLVQKQNDMIKSLSEQVKVLGSQGRGRKAVLTVTEKPDAGTMAKSEGAGQGFTAEQFFAKANTAFEAGKISGKDLNVISVSLRMQQPIDDALIKSVVSA